MRGLECAAWGTVARTPELKTSRNGVPYCSVSVAVAVGKDDAGKETTQWCKVTVFKAAAEEVAKTLVKGARCYFEGSGQIEQWQASDGSTRTQMSVAAWKLIRVSAIGQNRQRDASKPIGAPLTQPQPDGWQAPISEMRTAPQFDDAIPF